MRRFGLLLLLMVLLLPTIAIAQTISGEGTSSNIELNIPYKPSRLELATSDKIKVTFVGGAYIFSISTESNIVRFCEGSGEYVLSSDGTGDWTLAVSPITEGGTIEFSGIGSVVGNFFNLSNATTINISADFTTMKEAFTNFAVTLCHQYSGIDLWKATPLTDDYYYKGAADTFSQDFIISPLKGRSQYCWEVRCAPDISWTISIKK